jgi:ligand-binding sensor domain-containing protein
MTLATSSGAMEIRPLGEDMVACWQTEDGLPQSSVLAIAQSPNGYLWLATFNGLARFDGMHFTVFDTSNLPGLPSNRLTGLLVDQAGAL